MKTPTSILPHELAEALKQGCQLVDVREPVEHAESHISGAKLIPLGQLEQRCGELDPARPVIVMCRSGRRGAAAAEKLLARGFVEVGNLQGGMLAWQAAALPCAKAAKAVMPLMRQVQIAVGFCVLTASLLALWVDPRWVYVSLFFGAGLLFAGLSGFCGLALLLAKMPWNRVGQGSCSNHSCCA